MGLQNDAFTVGAMETERERASPRRELQSQAPARKITPIRRIPVGEEKRERQEVSGTDGDVGEVEKKRRAHQ